MSVMHYVALLRGINVGGNNVIKMTDLIAAVASCGYTNVSTYIQSGNVFFHSTQPKETIVTTLEQTLSKRFDYTSRVVVRSVKEIHQVLAHIPHRWKTHTDIRCYVAFVKEPTTPNDVLSQITVNEEVDFVAEGPGVIYMTTLLSGLTRSGFTKLIGKKIFQEVTIRNYNTTKNLLFQFNKTAKRL